VGSVKGQAECSLPTQGTLGWASVLSLERAPRVRQQKQFVAQAHCRSLRHVTIEA
jgi:hypothetical protein